MIIYPAIDIHREKCVRLFQGDYAKETVYSDSPIEMAKLLKNENATWLHLVDLNGAKNPKANQASLIKKLIQSVAINIQVGGGIRTATQIDAYFASGASRVVVGSLTVEAPKTVLQWMKKYGGERFVLALDVMFDEEMDPFIATHAWQKRSNKNLFDLLDYFIGEGVQHVLCTDITRDGVLSGPNFDLYQTLVTRFPTLQIQASGGMSTLDDIRRLKKMGLSGAIIGRALYEKKFTMSEAFIC